MHILHLYIRLMDKTDNQYQVIGPLKHFHRIQTYSDNFEPDKNANKNGC